MSSMELFNQTETIGDDYRNAGSPKGKNEIEISTEYSGKDGATGETMLGFENTKIWIYQKAFSSWRELAGTLIHEYRHRMHSITGDFQKWKQNFGRDMALDISEVFAHR